MTGLGLIRAGKFFAGWKFLHCPAGKDFPARRLRDRTAGPLLPRRRKAAARPSLRSDTL
jgi:hypothetical protein